MEKSVRLFTIYAKEDESFVEQLTVHLSLLRRKNIVTDYFDKEYSPVASWDKRTAFNFDDANYIVFLVSPDLLNAGCFQDEQIKNSFASAKDRAVTIIPILIRNCDVSKEPLLNGIDIIPANGQPIESAFWGDRNNAWNVIAADLKFIIGGGVVEETQPALVAAAIPATAIASKAMPVSKGMAWPLKLLLSLIGLGAMGAVTYYLVNYEPAPAVAAASTNPLADSNTKSAEQAPPTVIEQPVAVDPAPAEPTQKPKQVSKPASTKKNNNKPGKETVTQAKIDTVIAKPEPPPPPPKAPTITTAALEQMLFNYSQGTVSESEFAPFLCNKLETTVRYEKKSMTFHQMCEQIKDVKSKKVKKISVVAASYDGACINSLEVNMKKKGLFN